jgi:hypothetical protein
MRDGETATGPARGRWFAVGRSVEPDPAVAGAEAARAAIAGGNAQLLVVFCPAAYDHETLLHAIHGVSGGTPLIGCSTEGEISAEGPSDGGVVIAALGGDGFSVRTTAVTEAAQDVRAAGERIAEIAEQLEERRHRALLVLSDTRIGHQQDIVRGAYGVVGASMPLVGGCAAAGRQGEQPVQLHNRNVLTNSVVGAAIASDAPIGVGLRHGWTRVGEPLVVTRSGGPNVHTLNDRPALEAYLEALAAEPHAVADPDAFRTFALTHPLAISHRHGEDGARNVSAANVEDGSLRVTAGLPQGSVAWVMEGDRESVLGATTEACDEALGFLGDSEPLGLIAFDCAARRSVLGESGIQGEIEQLRSSAPDTPLAGGYTWGEIARVRGQNGFHNQTLVVLALA